MEACLYSVLGVRADASFEEIRAAYAQSLKKLQALIGRPDAPPHEVMDSLRSAYRTLSDPEKRRAYDQTRQQHSGANKTHADATSYGDLAAPVVAHASAVGADAAGATDQGRPRARYPLEFSGEGGAYFRIWIVNLLLSILTLGIYSAWAKVRREKFFHRNLQLAGAAFDYHGQPLAILKGRAIAVLFLVLLGIAQNISPVIYFLAIIASLPLIPWILVRAFRFRAHNTSYRGLRFRFDGRYREALTVFVGYGLLALLTLGACLPLWFRAQRQFILNHLLFGTTRFKNDLALWPVYRVFLVPMLLVLAALVFFGVGFAGLAATTQTSSHSVALGGLMVMFFLAILAATLLIGPYLRVRIANLVWNSTQIGPHQTQSTLKLMPYVGIVVSNFLLVIVTLGFFQPWAQVRIARYRAENGALMAAGSLDDFIADEERNTVAVGEEVADLFDFDVAL